jgi:hypothetical protein
MKKRAFFKRTILFFVATIAIIVFVIACSSDRQSKDSLPFIDVRNNYPEKEILLTDIAEVTYLHLNTDDDNYLYSGSIRYITENTIIVVDFGRGITSGNILFFTKDGMPKSYFNRRGQGPEEYSEVYRVFYDEATDDVFVCGLARDIIKVYSSNGKYKREIRLPQEVKADGNAIESFDEYSLFFRDINLTVKNSQARFENMPVEEETVSSFYRISKTDGKVLDYVELPLAPIFLGIIDNGMRIVGRAGTRHLLKYAEGVHLCNPENDTVYVYNKSKSVTPALYKTPSVGSTDPMTYLNNCVDMGQYQFLEVVTVRAGDEYIGVFPVKYYMRDKTNGEIIRPKLLLPDYRGKEFVITPSPLRIFKNEYVFEIDLTELKDADHENKLSGKLKELVDTLDENNDNNVFILVSFK